MSAAAMSMPAKPAGLPLFYHRVVGLEPAQHGDLRLDRGQDYSFAAHADNIPLVMGELEAAAQHYPILFTTGLDPTPVALVGLRREENLFVMPDGRWREGGYLPAYCRAYPFIFINTGSGDERYIGIDADAACLRRDGGDALFADGQPTPALETAIAFCDQYRNAAYAAKEFGKALADQGVLQEEAVSVTFDDGRTAQVRGFQVIRPERLDNIVDEVFLLWRHNGYLSGVFAHLFSLGRLNSLVELATPLSSDPAP